MRVLITGAGSYLGGAILGALRKQGVEADELDVRGRCRKKPFRAMTGWCTWRALPTERKRLKTGPCTSR